MQNLFHFAIYDTNISGTLPTEWPRVTHLHCHKAPLSGTIPYPIESVRTESETFFFRETAVSGSLPALYNIGESLQLFDVSSTRISGSLSSSSSTLSKLILLAAANTQLHGDLGVLASWSKMQHLVVYGCKLSGTMPIVPQNFRTILIQKNAISGEAEFFTNLNKLQDIDFNFNTISGWHSTRRLPYLAQASATLQYT